MKEETQRDQLYKDLEEQFLIWANQNDDIRGAVVVGTRAQKEPPVDEWADLDIVIYTTNPDTLTDNPEWLTNFGKPVLSYIFQIPGLSKNIEYYLRVDWKLILLYLSMIKKNILNY